MIGPAATIAERVGHVVLAVDGVAGLHAGTFGEVATYLPGRRVVGVRIGERGVEVHVVVHLGTDVGRVARAVQLAALSQWDRPMPCTVVVEDVVAASAVGVTDDVNAQEGSQT
jgi:hypothetical protein